MSNTMTLKDFLEHIQGVYKSIDLRTAAVRVADKWQNALTIIRLSYRDPTYIQKIHEDQMRKWWVTRPANFKIEMQGCPIGTWETVLCGIKSGTLSVNDIAIEFGRSVDLPSLQGVFGGNSFGNVLDRNYHVYEAISGEHLPLLTDKRFQNQVKAQTGFLPHILIRELLEVNFSESASFDLVVDAPFYAVVEDLDFSQQRLMVQVKFHKEIKDLNITAVVRTGDQDLNLSREGPARLSVDEEPSVRLDEDMRVWTSKVEFLSARPTDYLFLELIHTKPSALEIGRPYRKQVGQFLKSQQLAENPLLTAFGRFCSLDQLQEYLTNPTRAAPLKRVKKDPDATFELAVGWLLAICGLDMICLGQTKHETMENGKVTLFSMDMLAHYESENTILLIGCTIGVPNDKDVDNLKSVRRLLLDAEFKGTSLQVRPFVFSAAAELGNKERDGVRLLDAGDMREILNYIRRGEVARALSDYLGFPFKPKPRSDPF